MWDMGLGGGAGGGGGLHFVESADGVPRSPSVGAIVKNSGRSLRPIQEPGLDALVNRRIVHHPFWRVAESGVATCIAPQVAATRKRKKGPLLHGIKQHPMTDTTV